MEEILASGKADVIYMARGLLADPEFPEKVMANRGDETVKCLRCFVCMSERVATQTRRCSINPRIGRELEGMRLVPAPAPKRVIVVGGGIAGMMAAATAAERGHDVTLCEKSDRLGGILKTEQAISFKQEMYELSVKYAEKLDRLGVDVRLNFEADAAFVEGEAPDALIVAVGSNPIVPPLPGIDGGNVIVVNDFHLRQDEVAESAVVLGGGLAGCECAVELARRGVFAKVVEMRDEVAPDANIRHRPILLAEMEKAGVETLVGLTGLEVTADGLVCKNKDGEVVEVPGKTVICAVGQRANRSVAEQFAGAAPFVREAGDCIRPANITAATYEAYHGALDI
jgi:NADPH-dependent 2,4-dienoyl-CoA reductase/sulfur reductase-like enzyme